MDERDNNIKSTAAIADEILAVESQGGSNNSAVFWIHVITFVLGLGLLAFLIHWVGYQSILESVSKVGWGFLVVIGLNLVRHLLRSASLYLAIDPARRTFKFRSAVAARFGGEAVSFFSFTGPFLGDATKAVLLKRNISLTDGASAVIIDNLLYYVSVIVMILSGIAILLYYHGSNSTAISRALAAIIIFAVLMFAFLYAVIRFRLKPMSSAINALERRNLLPRFVSRRRLGLLAVELNVFEFYDARKAAVFLLFGLSLLVHAVTVAEVYVILVFLEIGSNISDAFIIVSLTKVINALFGFVPGTIGVMEGGSGIILRILGFTTAVGVALALVRRGAILFSTAIGLAILLWRGAERGTRHLSKK